MNILSNRDYGYIPENEFVSKAEKCREVYEIIDFRINSNTEKNEEQDVELKNNAKTDDSQSEAINKNAKDIVSQQQAIAANSKAIEEQKVAIEENGEKIAALIEGDFISKDEADKKYAPTEISEELVSLLAQVSMLESKMNDMSKSNVVEVSEITENKYLDLSSDFIFSDVEINDKTTIQGKSITMNGVKTSSNDNRLALKGKDVTINNLNIGGVYNKSQGNAVVTIDNANYITIKDSLISPSEAYNGIEIGLSSVSANIPKNISIDNCVFGEGFTNNAILIYKTASNAVINITNCTFDKIGNVLRLSNSTNASGITVNIANCVVKDFVKNYDEKGEIDYSYQGLILLQDYTSKLENVDENNLFGGGKIKINISNVTTPDGKVVNPTDIAEVLGCSCQKQIAYIYRNADKKVLEYNTENYPIFNIK